MIGLLAVHLLLAQAPLPHEDCLPYNPETVRIELRIAGWTLVDGRKLMETFATETDAQNGLALARRYSFQCFIGRHRPTRPNVTLREHRLDIVHYWKGPTGTQTTISPETCQPYVGSELRIEDNGRAGALVTDAKNFRIPVDNASDAKGLITLAHLYTTYCTIGRESGPFGRVDYWK